MNDFSKRPSDPAGEPDAKNESCYARWISADEVAVFRGPVLTWNGTVFVNPPPQILQKAGYLPLLDGTRREGAPLRTLYSTDGHCIYRHTIEVTP